MIGINELANDSRSGVNPALQKWSGHLGTIYIKTIVVNGNTVMNHKEVAYKHKILCTKRRLAASTLIFKIRTSDYYIYIWAETSPEIHT